MQRHSITIWTPPFLQAAMQHRDPGGWTAPTPRRRDPEAGIAVARRSRCGGPVEAIRALCVCRCRASASRSLRMNRPPRSSPCRTGRCARGAQTGRSRRSGHCLGSIGPVILASSSRSQRAMRWTIVLTLVTCSVPSVDVLRRLPV